MKLKCDLCKREADGKGCWMMIPHSEGFNGFALVGKEHSDGKREVEETILCMKCREQIAIFLCLLIKEGNEANH
ncbi:hypothetical protein LCGC14_0924440 [marine sediment metagenome]|uniref:Uncharacterized protein n=1 Tax=marine sediment metagenome TaxID=412755 RepID=A0A0F9PAI1_9ZZZZ